MTAVQAMDVVDVLCGLLAGEQGNLFHFMKEADAYIRPGEVGLRRLIQGMIEADARREEELIGLITERGGCPRLALVVPERQYMAYLSMEYMLPRLIESREASVRRYEKAVKEVGEEEGVAGVISKQLGELGEELEALRKAGKG